MTLRDIALAVRYLGPGWLLGRLAYAARRRCGRIERATPVRRWDEIPVARVALQQTPSCPPSSVARAPAIARGEFRLYSSRLVTAGFPPAWNRNQVSGEEVPVHTHWSRLGDFSFGDIKDVWELCRFGWAFDLVRQGGLEAEGIFWRLFDDWLEKNPPNCGPNWMCGQEAAIRLMAVVFALERFGMPVEKEGVVARFIVATGHRIASNLGYALAQKNNHGISECAGLLTAALLVPEYGAAAGWRARALQNLEAQVRELFYADGAFAQHSLVYHRLALHQLCWTALRLRGASLAEPDWLAASGRRATDFLAALTDGETGEAPLYGANDGADILPLTDCDFADMRPAVQLGCAVFHRRFEYRPGPWDGPALWLVEGAADFPRQAGASSEYWHAPEGGLLMLRRGRDRLSLRCPIHFVHRPSQADFGQVNIWLGGARVAIDGGSFSYNSAERFTALGSAREHNALTIDGREPMRKVSRFLYVPWPAGRVRPSQPEGADYEPDIATAIGVNWRRDVAARPGGGFIVSDTVEGARGREIRWHWRLVDADWELNHAGATAEIDGVPVAIRWELPERSVARLLRADEHSAAGWESRYYGSVRPAVSVEIRVRGGQKTAARFEFLRI